MSLFRAHIIWPVVATIALVGALVWFVRRSTPALPPVESVAAAASRKPAGLNLRCGSVSASQDAEPDSVTRRTEAELYLAIVRAAPYTDGASPLVVELVSIPILEQSRTSLEDWDPAALELVADHFSECFTLTPDRFPAGTRLVPWQTFPAKPLH